MKGPLPQKLSLRRKTKSQAGEILRNPFDLTKLLLMEQLCFSGKARSIHTGQSVQNEAVSAVFPGDCSSQPGAVGDLHHGKAIGNMAAGAGDTADPILIAVGGSLRLLPPDPG